eukprot:768338-Hanusia_phi.AAC.1
MIGRSYKEYAKKVPKLVPNDLEKVDQRIDREDEEKAGNEEEQDGEGGGKSGIGKKETVT